MKGWGSWNFLKKILFYFHLKSRMTKIRIHWKRQRKRERSSTHYSFPKMAATARTGPIWTQEIGASHIGVGAKENKPSFGALSRAAGTRTVALMGYWCHRQKLSLLLHGTSPEPGSFIIVIFYFAWCLHSWQKCKPVKTTEQGGEGQGLGTVSGTNASNFPFLPFSPIYERRGTARGRTKGCS